MAAEWPPVPLAIFTKDEARALAVVAFEAMRQHEQYLEGPRLPGALAVELDAMHTRKAAELRTAVVKLVGPAELADWRRGFRL